MNRRGAEEGKKKRPQLEVHKSTTKRGDLHRTCPNLALKNNNKLKGE